MQLITLVEDFKGSWNHDAWVSYETAYTRVVKGRTMFDLLLSKYPCVIETTALPSGRNRIYRIGSILKAMELYYKEQLKMKEYENTHLQKRINSSLPRNGHTGS